MGEQVSFQPVVSRAQIRRLLSVRSTFPTVVGALLTGVVLTCVPVLSAPPAQAAPAVASDELVTEQPDAVSAAATAREQGHRVEDLSQRTETTQVFANADGSWTSEEAASPVRAKDAQGRWADIDATLVKVDGGYAPVNALGGLVISDGGDRTFARMSVDGRDMGWQWPDVLPAPTIEGDFATYPNVVDGGDLVVTATPTGFRHDVVLHHAPADPVAFNIPMVTSGPTISADAQGSLLVETKAGEDLVSAAPAVMYDAPNPRTGEPEHVAAVDTTVRQTSTGAVITLDPDEGFLNDPATTFPVVVDPTWSAGNPDDTWIYTADKSAVHPYDSTLYVGTPNAGSTKYRSFVRFNGNSEPWEGQSVLGATFTLRNFNSSGTNCNGAAVEVRRVAGGWEPGSLNWNNQPSTSTTYAASKTERKGGSTGCSPGDVSWDVTGMVQDMANWAPNYGFRVSGVDELKTGTYREYRAAGTDVPPRLSVNFNSAPYTPATPSLTKGGEGRSCGSWMASGTATMPSFQATVADPNGDNVYASFWTERYNPAVNGGWQALQTQTSGWAGGVWPGSTVTVGMWESNAQVNGVFQDGEYRVRAQAVDTYGWGGGYSGTCVFYLDSRNPVLTMTSDVTWPDTVPEDSALQDEDHWVPRNSDYTLKLHLDPSGSVFGPVEGDPYPNRISDVEYYELKSDVPVINGKTTDNIYPTTPGDMRDYTIDLGAVDPGEHWVTAIAHDRAGRVSEPRTRHFRVQGPVLTRQYDLDEGTGSTLDGTLIDGQTAAPRFTLSPSGVGFVERTDLGSGHSYLHFDGSGVATSAQRVVDSGQAFSVSAWVRTEDVANRHVVLAQDTGTGSAFTLAIENSSAGKAHAVFTVTDPTGSTHTVTSTTEMDPNMWYVLAGSFDDLISPRRLRVWVADAEWPGHIAKTVNSSLTPTYAPATSMRAFIGAESIAGTWSNGWLGDIEDVRFYADEVADDDVSNHRWTDPPQ